MNKVNIEKIFYQNWLEIWMERMKLKFNAFLPSTLLIHLKLMKNKEMQILITCEL